MTTVTQRAEIDLTGYNVSSDPATQGEIALRWAKLTYIDTRLISRENHRDVIWPETDIDARMAEVDAHLTELGFTWDTKAEDIVLVKSLAQQIWTPEVVAARKVYLAAQAAAEAQAAN